MDNKKKIIYTFTSIFTFLVFISVTYAYIQFELGNSNPINVNMYTESNLNLIYTDCGSSESCDDLEVDLDVGDYLEKNFSVTNISDIALSFTLYFKDLVNEFVNDELAFTLLNGDTNAEIVSTTTMPYKTVADDVIILDNISIAAGETKKYKLIVTYLDVSDQSEDNLDATFNFKIGIKGKKYSE